MALLDQMMFHLKADEAGGFPMFDSKGSNHFAETSGTIGSMAGKVGTARQFVAADTEYARAALAGDLLLGDFDFTIRFYIRFQVVPSTTVAVSWGWLNAGSAARGLVIYWASNIQARVALGQGTGAVDVTSDGTFNVDTWYEFLFEHDATANTGTIYIDNAVPTPGVAIVGGPNPGSGFVDIGASPDQALYGSIAMDDISFWKRKLTAPEKAALTAFGTAGTQFPWGEVWPPRRSTKLGPRLGVGF